MLITKEFLEEKGFTLYVKDKGYYNYQDDLEIILFNVLDENRDTQLHIEDLASKRTVLHLSTCNTIYKLIKAFELLNIKL